MSSNPNDDRVAVVTGASSGIGRGIATRLAKDGIDVVNADIRETPKQGDFFETDVTTPTHQLVTTEHGVDSLFVETDTSDPGDVRELIEETIANFGRLDVLVNNAAIQVLGSTEEMSVADWEHVVGVNLTGYFLTAKFAIPHLVESLTGRVVNISSVNARFGGAGPAYAATKAGVVNLTRDLAVELADDSVTANAVLPGSVKTAVQDMNEEAGIQRQQETTALPRLGTPRDIGNAVAFFVSEEASWITGADLLVDGGYMASMSKTHDIK